MIPRPAFFIASSSRPESRNASPSPVAGRTVSRQVADGSNPDRDSCIQPESAVAAIEPGDELEAQEDRILERLLWV